jgi:hypothetical protein
LIEQLFAQDDALPENGKAAKRLLVVLARKILRKAFLCLTLHLRKAFLTTNNSGEDIWKISVSEAVGRQFAMLPQQRASAFRRHRRR